MGLNETWAKTIGVILLLVGLIGFFSNPILGLFGVNLLHNLVHLLTGALFAWAGFSSQAAAKKMNKWLGVVYLLVGVVGFFALQDLLMLTPADNYLHLAIGLVSVGFAAKAD